MPLPPRALRVGVVCVEFGLVGLVAYFLVQLTFDLMAVEPDLRSAASVPRPENGAVIATDRLLAFDPFYRQTIQEADSGPAISVPESSLAVEVFGLRASADGKGTAIVKMQDGGQKLIRIGDTIARGVTLAAVYADRLEVSRAGVREAIYLRPQAEREPGAASVAAPQRGAATARETTDDGQVAFDPASFGLTPVRRDRRIIGFQIPDPLPLPLVGSGLEAGDILTRANGAPLASFEQLQEMGAELSGTQFMALEIERRGERRNLTLTLRGNR